MTNAIVVPDAFKAPVAAIFQGQAAGDDLSGGITGGYGLIKYRGKVWSIQHNGNSMNLMRDDGDGPRGSIDVVILKANANMSKTFYMGGWDENNNNPPDCASANGIVPDQGVPHKQSNVCATCPKNAWGSAPNGGKGKACGDHRRMAVVPLADLRNEALGGPLLLRCPAASLQDLAAFDSRYKGMGYPYFTMAIKIGFDPAESYPKFTFAAIRPLTDVEGAVVMEMRNSPETARVVHEGTAPAVAPAAAQPAPFLEPTPAQPMIAPAQQVSPQPVAQPAAAPVAAAPVAAPAAATPNPVAPAAQPAAPAANGAGVAGGAAAGGTPTVSGFGPVAVASAVQQPAPAQPNGAAPANPVSNGSGVPQSPAGQAPAAPPAPAPTRAMTGFGAVTSEVTATPAEPAPSPVAAPAPAVVSAFEGSIDDRLNALLNT